MNTEQNSSVEATATRPPVVWSVAITFSLIAAVSLIVVPWYGFAHGYSGTAWALFFLFYMLNGIGIGAGYHRLWSHRTYEAHWSLRLFLAIAGAMALQNSILVWCCRHRVHHQHVDDNDRDPYSIGRGFWFAHMGWMVRDYPSAELDFSNCRDLERDPIVRWQHKYYWALAWGTNLGIPVILGLALGEFWGMLLLVGVLRLFVNHHVTFFINSLAHMWGRQPYTDENSARDNDFLALFTWGEGYHNYHHLFQSDYRNGVRWWQLDINKWFISACSGLRLARNLKRAPKFRIMRARLNMAFKRALEHAESGSVTDRWRQRVTEEYEQFSATVADWQTLQKERMEHAQQALRERWDEWDAKALKTRYRELEYRLKMQHRRMRSLLQVMPEAA